MSDSFSCVKYFVLYSVVAYNDQWWVIIAKGTDPETGKRIVTLDNKTGSIKVDGETAVTHIASPLECASAYCKANGGKVG